MVLPGLSREGHAACLQLRGQHIGRGRETGHVPRYPAAALRQPRHVPEATAASIPASRSTTGVSSAGVIAYPRSSFPSARAKTRPATSPVVESSGPPELPGRTCAASE